MNIFKKLRVDNRYTRENLSKILEISPSTIYCLETGKRNNKIC